jgi:guanylate kinase
MTTIITGNILSGKSTLARYLSKHGYAPAVMHTTRPMRERERDGVDYHFISDGEFDRMQAEGRFLTVLHAQTVYGIWKYGLSSDSLTEDSVIAIGSESGQILDSGRRVLFVLLDISEEDAMKRAIRRGDDAEEVIRRFRKDQPVFDALKGRADLALDATAAVGLNAAAIMGFVHT